jgi:hypothetical protein
MKKRGCKEIRYSHKMPLGITGIIRIREIKLNESIFRKYIDGFLRR